MWRIKKNLKFILKTHKIGKAKDDGRRKGVASQGPIAFGGGLLYLNLTSFYLLLDPCLLVFSYPI